MPDESAPPPPPQPSGEPVSLLNVFDVETAIGPRRLLCFVDPGTAAARGIDPRVIVGEFPLGLDRPPTPADLKPEQGFINAFITYMNEVVAVAPRLLEQAQQSAGQMLCVVDPRVDAQEGAPPHAHEVLGAYQVDQGGRIVPGSFGYNRDHRWLDESTGNSGVFADTTFYLWLHPTFGSSGPPSE